MKNININILTDNEHDSTSFYRAWGVWNQIRKKVNLPIQLFKERGFGWNTVGFYDIVFFHRPNNQDHLNAITVARKNGIPVWVDFDDDLINIQSHNPAYGAFKDKANTIKEICSLSDVVTVSTEGLRQNYMKAFGTNGGNIEVIENFVAYENLPFCVPQKKAKFRILWRGSNTHEMDWITHRDAFLEFLKDKKNVKFINIGDMPLSIKKDIEKHCEVESVWGRRLIDYLLWLRTGVADLLFVPLEDNLFNQAKSDCACQEGLIGGMDSVAPEWNTKYGFTYGNVTESLEEAYSEWSERYDDYKKEIVSQQKQLRDEWKERFMQRVDIMRKILNIPEIKE